MLTPKTIIVSACDELYSVLANDLFASIKNLTFAAPFDLGLLDVGMTDAMRDYFKQLGVQVEPVQSDIEYPSRAHWEKVKPGVRTLTARPFLRRYFPGYDLYIWLDADVWVQTPEAIDTMMAEAPKSNAMLIACELDRCYTPFFQDAQIWHTFANWYQTNFGSDIAGQMLLKPMLNAGVFALMKDAPHWDAWAQIYTEALQATTDLNDKTFMADQLGLNILLYQKGLPCSVMPAAFNWLTCHALPKLDRATGLYVEPLPPYRPISHIHLTQPNKLQVENIQCTDGSTIVRNLTYSGRTKTN